VSCFLNKLLTPGSLNSFLIESVVAFNAFGCPSSTTYDSSKGHKNKYVDEHEALQERLHHSCGLWLTASAINHSCLSNCRRSFIGDFMVIRATCDIPADTELTHWYTVPTGDRDKMKDSLAHWGFECTCLICEDTKTVVKKFSKKRKDLMQDIKHSFSNKDALDFAKIERQLRAYEATYKKSPTAIP
jgi:hypothetical protein